MEQRGKARVSLPTIVLYRNSQVWLGDRNPSPGTFSKSCFWTKVYSSQVEHLLAHWENERLGTARELWCIEIKSSGGWVLGLLLLLIINIKYEFLWKQSLSPSSGGLSVDVSKARKVLHVLVLRTPACVHVTRVSVPRGMHRWARVACVGCWHLWPARSNWGRMQPGSAAHQARLHPRSGAIKRVLVEEKESPQN